MSKVRVLHVVSSLSIGNGITGVIMNYYRNIDRRIIQFDFLYFEDSIESHNNEINSLGGRTFKINSPRINNFVFYKKYLNKYFRDFKFNYKIVHSHELVFLSLISSALRKNNTKHIIAHSHSVAYSYQTLKALRNFVLSLPVKRISDSFCACSKASAKFWFGEEYVSNGRVNLVKNAIETEKFSFNKNDRNEVRKTLGLENSFVIGHVGRLSKEKNQMFLIDVFHEIHKKRPDSRLLLVGDGPMYTEIKSKIQSFNLEDKVTLLGQRSDANKFYQAMDVFVFPSISEGLGMAAIEAQVSGLQCIISNTITKEVDIFNSKFASLKENPKTWAEIILKANNNRENAYQCIEESGYHITKEARNLEIYYKDIIEGIYK
ncbi:glycosyltransferase family 1 protein [Sporosarcina sp. CAU 1771]